MTEVQIHDIRINYRDASARTKNFEWILVPLSLSLYRPNLYFVEPLPLALSFPLFRLTFVDSLRRESLSKG